MEIRLKYLKPADFQELSVPVLPRHPFFVRVSLLSVDRSVSLSEFLFSLWTQKCVCVRVSLLSVDTEVCLFQSFSSVYR